MNAIAKALIVIAATAAFPAIAQNAPAPRMGPIQASPEPLDLSRLRPVDSAGRSIPYRGLSGKEIENVNVTLPNGDKVGEVDKALVDSDNRIVAVTVDAGVGPLGLGGEKVVVALDQLYYDWVKDRFITTLKADQLKAMPHWDRAEK